MTDLKTLLRWCGYDRDEYTSQRIGSLTDWEELESQQALDDPDCEWEDVPV